MLLKRQHSNRGNRPRWCLPFPGSKKREFGKCSLGVASHPHGRLKRNRPTIPAKEAPAITGSQLVDDIEKLARAAFSAKKRSRRYPRLEWPGKWRVDGARVERRNDRFRIAPTDFDREAAH